jgi:protein gp37
MGITKIEWPDKGFSPWLGCTEISDGCRDCYAKRSHGGLASWGNHPRRRTSRDYWRQPHYWNADGPRFQREHGRRERVFGDHLCDAFDNQVDPQVRADYWKLIRATPNLDWLMLTKRPQNIARMLPADWGSGYMNVWLGISAETEHYYKQRWSILAAIPAALRFISYEPTLGPLGAIDLGIGVLPDWIIVGGETGDPQWARDVLDRCRKFGIPFFMKQMTNRASIPTDLMVRQFPIIRR